MPETDRLEAGLPATKQGYADQIGVNVQSLHKWDSRPDVKAEVRARLQERQGSPERVGALLDDLYARGRGGDLKASEQWLKAMGYMRGAAPVAEKPQSAGAMSDDELLARIQELTAKPAITVSLN